ncbi:MAG: hypothetical protein F6K26_12285 [Moorea sp. SIO2I5]|nr:hypothetical protein [Moorena sp. SIO2I5]
MQRGLGGFPHERLHQEQKQLLFRYPHRILTQSVWFSPALASVAESGSNSSEC